MSEIERHVEQQKHLDHNLRALQPRMETHVSRILLTNDSSYNATIVTYGYNHSNSYGYNLAESIAMCLILGGIIITTIIGKLNGQKWFFHKQIISAN